MNPLAIDDLPKHSAWARHLLDPTGEPPEDPEAYASVETYDEMYGYLLEEFRAESADPEAFVRRIYAKGRSDPGPISIRGDLFLASPEELLDHDRVAVREALSGVTAPPETVVDLGCGYGSALGELADVFPDATVVGGEYSQHGVELARLLHAERDRISVEQFDFHGAWDLLDESEGDTLIFTRGALTTLREVGRVVDRSAALASDGDVVGGVHLEQVDVHPETTLGLLRRRYERIRGYDGTLLDELERRDDVDVTAVAYDAIGANPLHPLTAVRWRTGD